MPTIITKSLKKNIYMGWGSLGSIAGSYGGTTCVIPVSCECIWSAPMVSLVLPAFDDTGSLGSPPNQWSMPLVPPWMTVSHFFAGNRETELKPTIHFTPNFRFSCLSSSLDIPVI